LKKQDVTKTSGIRNPETKPKESQGKRLLTIPEAGEYLGRSIWSIRELIWKGSLPIVREGRRIHLDITDLEAWVKERKIRYTH
jgi:excisionase family DNA binding protein